MAAWDWTGSPGGMPILYYVQRHLPCPCTQASRLSTLHQPPDETPRQRDAAGSTRRERPPIQRFAGRSLWSLGSHAIFAVFTTTTTAAMKSTVASILKVAGMLPKFSGRLLFLHLDGWGPIGRRRLNGRGQSSRPELYTLIGIQFWGTPP
jgi:hypothetical protein